MVCKLTFIFQSAWNWTVKEAVVNEYWWEISFVFFPQAEAARESKQNPMIQRNSSFASSHEVWKYICELGISKVRTDLYSLKILSTWLGTGVRSCKSGKGLISASVPCSYWCGSGFCCSVAFWGVSVVLYGNLAECVCVGFQRRVNISVHILADGNWN